MSKTLAYRVDRERSGAGRRAVQRQLASDAGYVLDWQRLDADRNIAASAAIMGGDSAPMPKMLDELIREP